MATNDPLGLLGPNSPFVQPPEEAEDDPGFLESFASGVAGGALEPFSFVPGVEGFLEGLEEHQGEGIGDEIGHALGFLGGFALPLFPALRVGSTAARSLGLALKTKKGLELTRTGILTQGAIAGGLLGAGRSAENPQQRLQHAAIDAALFGVGDVAMHQLFRVLGGTALFQSAKGGRAELQRTAHQAVQRGVETPKEAALIARGLTRTEALLQMGDESVHLSALRTQLGLGESAVTRVGRGELRVVPAFEGDRELLSAALDNAENVTYRYVTRETLSGDKLTDVLVARGASISDELVETYEKHGVIPGQLGIRAGKKHVIEKVSAKGNHYMARQVGSSQATPVPKEEMQLLNYVLPRENMRKFTIEEAEGFWTEFVRRNGSEFPSTSSEVPLEPRLKGTKVVDEADAPLRVYHGTTEDFAKYDLGLTTPGNTIAGGINFVDNPEFAQMFAKGPGANVRSAYLNLRRIIEPREMGMDEFKTVIAKARELFPDKLPQLEKIKFPKEWAKQAEELLTPLERSRVYRELGYDGATYKVKNGRVWVAFDNKSVVPAFETQLGGFQSAFSKFTASKGLFGTAREELQQFFTQKQTEALREIAPDAVEALERVAKASREAVRKNSHVSGDLFAQASERGFFLERRPPEGDEELWAWVLKRHRNGNTQRFASKDEVKAFLDDYRPEMPDLAGTEAFPLANNVGGGNSGNGAQFSWDTGDLSNLNMPWMVSAGAEVLPRMSVLRMFTDSMIKQMGPDAPPLWDVVSRIAMGRRISQNNVYDLGRRVTKLRGGKMFRPRTVRTERYDEFFDLVSAEPERWGRLAKRLDLNATEVKTAQTYREELEQVIEGIRGLDLEADTFIEAIWPAFRRLPQDEWRKLFKDAGLSDDVIKWFREIDSIGKVAKHERDPFRELLAWGRAVEHMNHIQKPLQDGYELLQSLKVSTDVADDALRAQAKAANQNTLIPRKLLSDYLSLVISGTPEAHYTVRVASADMLKTLGIELDQGTRDQFAHALMSLNYGAFMGFRPGLAIRNMTQILFTTLPMVGARDLGAGIKFAVSKGSREELLKSNVITRGGAFVPDFEEIQGAGTLGHVVAKWVNTSRKASDVVKSVQQAGLLMYRGADEFNRAVSYGAMKNKATRALQRWRGVSKSGHGDIKKFNQDSGLDMLGEAITRRFHQIMEAEGETAAIRWAGVQMSNESQWIYELGAGPSLFSHGAGKVFGMYGTWPSWLTAHLYRGASKLRSNPKAFAQFSAWTMAIHGAFAATAYSGVADLSRWSGLSSLRWMGGPGFDIFKDVSDIWTGVTRSGEATADRQIALGQYGMKHKDRPGLAPNVEVDDWGEAAFGTLGMITPGAYAIRDVMKAFDYQDDPYRFALRMTGIPIIAAGRNFPRLTVTGGK